MTIVVGGGVAGATAAYALAQAGASNVLVLECGHVGDGSFGASAAPAHASTDAKRWAEGGLYPHASRSGTAVLPSTGTIKQIMTSYYCSSKDFIRHHGEGGAAMYLACSSKGLQLQRELAMKYLPNPDKQFRSLGTVCLGTAAEEEELSEEYATLVRLGCPGVEKWSSEQVKASYGAGDGFTCGLFFPNDAVIDSTAYTQCLMQAAVATGSVTLWQGCPPVVAVHDKVGGATVVFPDGSHLSARNVIVATGGLFLDPALAGVMSPSWSFLVGMPDPTATAERRSSPNYYSFGFGCDWCITDGAWRVSGEDHFSALKAPRFQERCAALVDWSVKHKPALAASVEAGKVETQYGVTSETPDYLPLVGKPRPDSSVCYLLGCNALGQSILTYAALLVPGILGLSPLTDLQRDSLDFMAISRFSLLPVVRGPLLPQTTPMGLPRAKL